MLNNLLSGLAIAILSTPMFAASSAPVATEIRQVSKEAPFQADDGSMIRAIPHTGATEAAKN